MSEAIQRVRRQLKLYEEQPETWKVEHDAAMHCIDVEDASAFGVFLFDRITGLDESYRAMLFSGKASFDSSLVNEVEELYRLWANPSQAVLRELETAERNGFQVDKAEEFRLHFKEVKGILAPDQSFFLGESLQKLRDDALDAHRRGETEPLGA